MNYQFYLYQISTVDEILDANFRLTGSKEVLNIIEQDTKVMRHHHEQFNCINEISILFFSTHRDRLNIFSYAIALMHAWNI